MTLLIVLMAGGLCLDARPALHVRQAAFGSAPASKSTLVSCTSCASGSEGDLRLPVWRRVLRIVLGLPPEPPADSPGRLPAALQRARRERYSHLRKLFGAPSPASIALRACVTYVLLLVYCLSIGLQVTYLPNPWRLISILATFGTTSVFFVTVRKAFEPPKKKKKKAKKSASSDTDDRSP